MSTITNTHVVGGAYRYNGKAYKVVYVWPTGDVSVIWDGETMASMETMGAPTVTISLPDSPAAERDKGESTDLEAEKVPPADDADQGQADTDKEAQPTAVGTDADNVRALLELVEKTADADKEAPRAEPATPQGETPEVTSAQIGTGKAVHLVILNAEDYVTSKCGQSGPPRKPGADVTCKRCLKV